MTPNEKVVKARVALVLDHPFFGSLALKLTVKEDPECKTAWVDGTHLGYNPEFVDELPSDELKGLIAHEVMHCGLNHIARKGDRDGHRWNLACDYAINPILLDYGMALPDGALNDPQYYDMDADTIYTKLPENGGGGGGGGGGDEGEEVGGCGVMREPTTEDGQSLSDAELKEMDHDWEVATAQAAQQAKAMGKLPANLGEMVGEMLRPVANWKYILQRFITQWVKDEYTWRRPDRRFIHDDIYCPSLGNESMGEIVIGWDTSGSTDEFKIRFASEINYILSQFSTTVHIVYCDSQVQKVQTLNTPDDLPFKMECPRGGGTAFQPVFDWVDNRIQETGVEPACLIYLTDLYGRTPIQPDYPVLWACTNEQVADFGETINISM
jgi:predicted metal-dependent peptidase